MTVAYAWKARAGNRKLRLSHACGILVVMSKQRPVQFTLISLFAATTTICVVLASGDTFIEMAVVLLGISGMYLAFRMRRGLHDSTKVVLTVVVGLLMWANMRVSPLAAVYDAGPPVGYGPIGRYVAMRGWPLSPWMFCTYRSMMPHLEVREFWGILILDAVVALVILVAVGFLMEWFVRRWKN